MNLQHVLENADLGSVDLLTKQLLKMMTSNVVGKTAHARRLKWLEIASIAESRAQVIGRSEPANSVPIHQLSSDPSQSPVFES